MIIREANINDVDSIVSLINNYAKKELMLSKTTYKIFCTIQNFFVAEIDNKVVGCASLSVLWKDLCEICSLAVDNNYYKRGIGKTLTLKCIVRAKKLKMPKVLALTYQNQFFEKLNFKLVDKNIFLRKILRECLECPKLDCCDESAYLLELD